MHSNFKFRATSTVLPTQMRKSEKVAFRHLNFGVRQAERQYSVYGIEYSSKTCGLVGGGSSMIARCTCSCIVVVVAACAVPRAQYPVVLRRCWTGYGLWAMSSRSNQSLSSVRSTDCGLCIQHSQVTLGAPCPVPVLRTRIRNWRTHVAPPVSPPGT